MTNYYDVLGVPRDASEAIIRERFRVLARESHPDRFMDPVKKKDAESRFQVLTEAVNVLTSETRRKAHDFDLDKGKEGVAHDPKAVARVYLAKGVKSFNEGNFAEAVALFDMAVKHYDKDPKSQHYLALACQRIPSQVRKGTIAIEAAIRLDPHNGGFHKDAGKLYRMAGMTAKAERHLEEALKWMPDDPEILRLLAEIKPPSDSRKILGTFFGRKG